jgi:hypothetical protein
VTKVPPLAPSTGGAGCDDASAQARRRSARFGGPKSIHGNALGARCLSAHAAAAPWLRHLVCPSVSVTTPPEIIPYYRLNHSIWSLSDNKEASR